MRGLPARLAVLAALLAGLMAMEDGMTVRASADSPCRQEVLGWIPYWDQARAARSLRANADVLTHVSLFWYYVNRKGDVRLYSAAKEDKDLVATARAAGVKVLGLVANLTDEEGVETWDRAAVRRAIATPGARARHVAALVELARRMELDGINIDYEGLAPADRDDFTLFIGALGKALHADGRLLAVAIHPDTGEEGGAATGALAQDWIALALAADQLHIMTYGEHTSDGPPGPIASTAWVDAVVSHALERVRVPPERLWLGIGLYAEAWGGACEGDECGGEDLTYADLARIVRKDGGGRERDEVAGANRLTDRDGRTIYFEDAWSVGGKLELARRHGICRLALWRLGGEDPGVWNLLRASAARKMEPVR